MANVTVQSRVNPKLKNQAEILFTSMGLSVSDAIRIFLQQCVNIGGIPFQPTAKNPNAQTLEAFAEVSKGKGKRFKNNQDFYKDLGI